MRLGIVFLLGIILFGCIGNDYVDNYVEPDLRITNGLDSLKQNSTYHLKTLYFNNVGKLEETALSWSSSDPLVATVNDTGLVKGIAKGKVVIRVEKSVGGKVVFDTDTFGVGSSTITSGVKTRYGTVVTSSAYELKGDFTITQISGGIRVSLAANYKASNALPGLYVYLSNNATTTSGAYEIGAVKVFQGAHSYDILGVGINDYAYLLYFCKPFNVKVGDGVIKN